jgi:hypothetical protein
MITYWFSAPVASWWPLAFAIAFAVVAVALVLATIVRRTMERDVLTVALLYGVSFGMVAVSEFLRYLDLAFGWSLGKAFAMSPDLATFTAIAAAVFAGVAIVVALGIQFLEERSYRHMHPALVRPVHASTNDWGEGQLT